MWGAPASGLVISTLSIKDLRSWARSPAAEQSDSPIFPNVMLLPPEGLCHVGLCLWGSHTEELTVRSHISQPCLPLAFLCPPTPACSALDQGHPQSLKLMTPLCSVLIRWPPFTTATSFQSLLVFIFVVCFCHPILFFLQVLHCTCLWIWKRYYKLQKIPGNQFRASNQDLYSGIPEEGNCWVSPHVWQVDSS